MKSIEIAEIKSLFVGGRAVTVSDVPVATVAHASGASLSFDMNGEHQVEQLYAQIVRLRHPKTAYPILMWHGGSMTGAMWETTPDGRPGWQMYFLRQGYDVCISDAVERGRATAAMPRIWNHAPVYLSKQFAWQHFRIGTCDLADPWRPYPGVQFPVHSIDMFQKQLCATWLGNSPAHQARYHELVQTLGPCVIMAFSQSGRFAVEAAYHLPTLVKGLVLIEPSSAPAKGNYDPTIVSHIPILELWGDNLDTPTFRDAVASSSQWFGEVAAVNSQAKWISLPERGITGNTHAMMMDLNSDVVASVVADWLEDAQLNV